MLYKALIGRMFGNNTPEVAETGHSTSSIARMSYDKVPELAGLLPRLLKLGSSISQDDSIGPAPGLSVEAIFPALELIRRAGPPPGMYDLARGAVAYHLGSKVWLVRAMASRTFSSLAHEEDGVEEISLLFQLSCLSQNELHGRLLAVKHISETILMDAELSTSKFLEPLLNFLN